MPSLDHLHTSQEVGFTICNAVLKFPLLKGEFELYSMNEWKANLRGQ